MWVTQHVPPTVPSGPNTAETRPPPKPDPAGRARSRVRRRGAEGPNPQGREGGLKNNRRRIDRTRRCWAIFRPRRKRMTRILSLHERLEGKKRTRRHEPSERLLFVAAHRPMWMPLENWYRQLEVIESKREEKTVFVALDVFRNTRNCWICTPCCLSLSSVEPRASCSSPDSCLKSQALSQSPRGREPALPAGAHSALGLNPGSCRRSQTPSQCRDRHAAGNQPFLPVRTLPWGSNPGPCRRSQTPSQCRDRHEAGNQPFPPTCIQQSSIFQLPPATNNHQQRSAHYVHYHATILGGKIVWRQVTNPKAAALTQSPAVVLRPHASFPVIPYTLPTDDPMFNPPSGDPQSSSQNAIQQSSTQRAILLFKSSAADPSIQRAILLFKSSAADPSIQRAILRSKSSTLNSRFFDPACNPSLGYFNIHPSRKAPFNHRHESPIMQWGRPMSSRLPATIQVAPPEPRPLLRSKWK